MHSRDSWAKEIFSISNTWAKQSLTKEMVSFKRGYWLLYNSSVSISYFFIKSRKIQKLATL